MIPEKHVRKLVLAHRGLDERMSGAIWINQDEPEAWLVEILPTMHDDDRAGDPTYFAPGVSFRFPLALIIGNLKSLKAAVTKNRRLAQSVAEGTVLHGETKSELKELLRAAKARTKKKAA